MPRPNWQRVGRSAQIVKDRNAGGGWKTVPDFGWKIEQVAGGADAQPYWKVTSQDGTVWRFGYTKDAQWQVPYVGNDPGEPCYDRFLNKDIPPTCTGVWRWNLDQELDSNENVIDYSYNRESNYFCLPSCTHELYRVLPYDRGGTLAKVQWGHNTQVPGSVPTARTTFTTADRGGVDVPTDLQCTQAANCNNSAIGFFSTRKLTSVLTESLNPTSNGWDPVDRLDLAQTWIYQRTDFGPADDPALWLDTVQQIGLAATPEVALPPLDFDAVMLAGKMDYDSMSDWTDLLSWRMVPRIAAIVTGWAAAPRSPMGRPMRAAAARGVTAPTTSPTRPATATTSTWAATVDGKQTSMVYDAAGQRLIRRDPDGSATLYLGPMELRLSGGLVAGKRYYSASDGSQIAMRDATGVTWLLAGQHGSTQLAINATTGTINRERYLPYGQRRGGDDLPFTDRGFLGKIEDAATGLTYLGARYYDPAIAKFISTDPELDLRTPEWANPYSYAANDPITQSDPDGRRVDTGGGSTDQSYGYARDKKSPNANQNFASTHRASGQKKSARERKIHKQRQRANERQRKSIAAWKKREKGRSRYCNREAALRKEESEAYRWSMQQVGLYDKELAGYSPMRFMYKTLRIKPPKTSIGTTNTTAKQTVKAADCNSFLPGTRVLMADGAKKSIENIKAGDKVAATDPKTGKSEAKSVITPMASKGANNLVRVTVDSDGDQGSETGIVTATDKHPFWAPTARQWKQAGTLRPGQWLQTSQGTYLKIAAIEKSTAADQRVYNLTVADLHTYYVLAGATPVLVHNSDGKCGVWFNEFDGLPKGKQGHVREMASVDEMRAAFEKWTADAERLPARGPKIPDVYKLEDGTVIQWRGASRSGGETIDIFPTEGKGMKVHLPGE